MSHSGAPGGELAETRFTVLGADQAGPVRILAEPLTGRTHQIRVHAAASGFPIRGDALYGGAPARRLCLHAHQVTFCHPATGIEHTVTAAPSFADDSRFQLRQALIDPALTNAYRLAHGAADGPEWMGWSLDRLGPFLLASGEATELSTALREGPLQEWLSECDAGRPAAHPNARFTAPAHQDPAIAPEWEGPAGVPIDRIMFGGRRMTVVPLVREAFDWEHGVFMGSIMSSETTAAAFGEVGKLRFDPFAMLPFCGYNMADYWAHWLRIGQSTPPDKLPRIFYVNWFRKDGEGRFLWPGFGENSRVLEWMFRRCDGEIGAEETPIGLVPHPAHLNLDGLDLAHEHLAELLRVDEPAWTAELTQLEEHYDRFGDRLPAQRAGQLELLARRLNG